LAAVTVNAVALVLRYGTVIQEHIIEITFNANGDTVDGVKD
jgi:hypothetical protein